MIVLSVFSRRRTNGPVRRLQPRDGGLGVAPGLDRDEEVALELGLRAEQAGVEELQIDHRSPTWFSTGVPVRAMR